MNTQSDIDIYDTEYRYSQEYEDEEEEEEEEEDFGTSLHRSTITLSGSPHKTSTSPLKLHHIDSKYDINNLVKQSNSSGDMTPISSSSSSSSLSTATTAATRSTKDMAITIDMTEYLEDRNDDGSSALSSLEYGYGVGQQPTSSSRPYQQHYRYRQQQQQPRHPPNHYGYDLQQEKQRRRQQQQQQLRKESNAQSQQKSNDQSLQQSNSTSQRRLSTSQLQQQCRQQQQQHQQLQQQQKLYQQQRQSQENLNCKESNHRERLAHLQAITEDPDQDTGGSETAGTEAASTVMSSSSSSSSLGETSQHNSGIETVTLLTIKVSGNTSCNNDSDFYNVDDSAAVVTPDEQTFPQKEPSYSGLRSRSGSMSSTHQQHLAALNSSPSVPVPALPAYVQQQQQQQQQNSDPERSVVVNIQNNVVSPTGTAGWERDDSNSATPITPTPNHSFDSKKHGSSSHSQTTSLFDFLRGRKSSIPKNNHQATAAAAAAASVIAAGAATTAAVTPTSTIATIGSNGELIVTDNKSKTGQGSGPVNIPFTTTPPPIYRSFLGSILGSPIPPSTRKQSMDVHALQANQERIANTQANTNNAVINASMSMISNMIPNMGINVDNAATRIDRQSPPPPSTALPSLAVATNPSNSSSVGSINSTSREQPSSSLTNSSAESVGGATKTTQSAFSRVAAAVVGATVGKRRQSVVNEFEAGTSKQKTIGQHDGQFSSTYGSMQRPVPGLDQEDLNNHVTYMRAERNFSEMVEYAERLYHTVLNKDVALEFSRKQTTVLQKELEKTRSAIDDDRKELVDEVDRVKEQIVTMEENFLLWRTKVISDQMAQQEDFLHERLIKQDRIEELEDDLDSSRDEVTRLRNRLLVLEYEDGYVGPSTFLSEGDITSNSSSNYNGYITNDDNNNDSNNLSSQRASTAITIEQGPMTIATHKRRSADFMVLEKKAQSFEAQVQELKRLLETERQERQRDLVESRMRMHEKCVKLEQEVQAAKMESTMYTEMMHEIVSENDDLRKRVKEVQRKLRHHMAKCQDYGADDDSVYGSEDEMEDIMI